LNKNSEQLVTATLVVTIVVSIIILFFGIVYNSSTEEKYKVELIKEEMDLVRINEKSIIVEIADSQEEYRIGLMNHNELEKDHGMLFIFEEEKIHSFWMKNMKFRIDILWIDSNGYIVHIEKDLPPCDNNCVMYTPEKESKYVLEVESGFTDEYKINIREFVELDLVDSTGLN